MPETRIPVKVTRVDKQKDLIVHIRCMRSIPIVSVFLTGGPLMLIEQNINFNVGVINGGTACASERPSTNARVSSYLNWIQDQTRATTYCVL